MHRAAVSQLLTLQLKHMHKTRESGQIYDGTQYGAKKATKDKVTIGTYKHKMINQLQCNRDNTSLQMTNRKRSGYVIHTQVCPDIPRCFFLGGSCDLKATSNGAF